MRARWVVAGLAVGAAIVGSVGVRAAPAPHLSSDASTTQVSQSLAVVVPSELVGAWQRRDAYLVVGPNGAARFRWRTQTCATDILDPCDRETADGALLYGAHADIGLLAPQPGAARTRMDGAIVSVTPPGLLVVGPVSIQRMASDLIELDQGDRRIELCRTPRDLNSCDALW